MSQNKVGLFGWRAFIQPVKTIKKKTFKKLRLAGKKAGPPKSLF